MKNTEQEVKRTNIRQHLCKGFSLLEIMGLIALLGCAIIVAHHFVA